MNKEKDYTTFIKECCDNCYYNYRCHNIYDPLTSALEFRSCVGYYAYHYLNNYQ